MFSKLLHWKVKLDKIANADKLLFLNFKDNFYSLKAEDLNGLFLFERKGRKIYIVLIWVIFEIFGTIFNLVY